MSYKRKNGQLNVNLLENNNSKKNKSNNSSKLMTFGNNFGESYCFDDILMEPLLSNVKSRKDIDLEVDLGNNGRHLYLKNPLISSPMDTVTEDQMAIKMSLKGGLGIIHRFMTVEEQVSQVKKAKR